MISKLTRLIDAWEQTARSMTDLCATLLDADWNRATECPGWSVRDCVSHVIGVELELLGEPVPAHQLARDLRHLRDDFARHLEIAVDLRRCHTAPEMTGELRSTIDRRAAMLRASENGLETEVDGPMGTRWPFRRLLLIRIFDVWAHEQDIRRAVESPGNLDGPAAEVSRDVISSALPRVVAKDAGAPPGSSVVFEVSGPIAFTNVVTVDDAGQGKVHEGVTREPTVTLRTDWETFVRLACGRVRPEAVTPAVAVTGDAALARRVLAELAVTP